MQPKAVDGEKFQANHEDVFLLPCEKCVIRFYSSSVKRKKSKITFWKFTCVNNFGNNNFLFWKVG